MCFMKSFEESASLVSVYSLKDQSSETHGRSRLLLTDRGLPRREILTDMND